MRPYRSLDTQAHLDDLVVRLERVHPDSARAWGTMTSHEMLRHFADSF
jgi:hypothetical protein